MVRQHRKKISKNLVIDASLARAAGDKTPQSISCREFLLNVRMICHKIVINKPIKSEWMEHASPFAKTWLTSMKAKKKQKEVDVSNDYLFTDIDQPNVSKNNNKAMKKDSFLIESAIKTDKTIISLDDKAKKLFSRLSEQVAEIKPIVWLNPTCETVENIKEWLISGANSVERWTLDHYKNKDT